MYATQTQDDQRDPDRIGVDSERTDRPVREGADDGLGGASRLSRVQEGADRTGTGHHLGYPAGAVRPEEVTNQRNGKSGKTVLTDDGPL